MYTLTLRISSISWSAFARADAKFSPEPFFTCAKKRTTLYTYTNSFKQNHAQNASIFQQSAKISKEKISNTKKIV